MIPMTVRDSLWSCSSHRTWLQAGPLHRSFTQFFSSSVHSSKFFSSLHSTVLLLPNSAWRFFVLGAAELKYIIKMYKATANWSNCFCTSFTCEKIPGFESQWLVQITPPVEEAINTGLVSSCALPVQISSLMCHLLHFACIVLSTH